MRGSAEQAKLVLVDRVLTELPAAHWVALDDLAELLEIESIAVAERLRDLRPHNWHRVLTADGRTVAALAGLEEKQLNLLGDEGFDTNLLGIAEPHQRLANEELVWIVQGSVNSAERQARAWLVRGSSVKGHNLVAEWLADGFCSLAAARLGHVSPGATLEDVKAAVDRDYDYLSYSARNDHAAEFHMFISRMAPGDVVVTASEGEIHLGTITGDAQQVNSEGGLSNLRRSVDWRTRRNPIDYADVPDTIAARLSNQNTVVDLTADIDLLEAMLPELSDEEPVEQVKPREAVLIDATDELADKLLLSRDFLQETIDLLRDRRQIILYGPPGTGKTFLAQHLSWHLTDRSMVRLVQFHPAYSYEDFFEGFRPTPSKDGYGVGFRLAPGPLRRLVDAAILNPDQPHILIIDEINRANLAKVFGELYFLLEYRDHTVSLTYAEEGAADFSLPKNVYLIGTMNTADRSIALVDAAMRRRFAFLELHPTEPPVGGVLLRWLEKRELDTSAAQLLDALNSRIEDRDFRIGPSYLMRPEIYRTGGLERVWRTSILPLLVEHHYGEGVDVEGIYGLDALRASLSGNDEP